MLNTNLRGERVQVVLIEGAEGFGKSHSHKLVKHTVDYLNERGHVAKPTLVEFPQKLSPPHQTPLAFAQKVFSAMSINPQIISSFLDSAEDFTQQFVSISETHFNGQCWIYIDDLDGWILGSMLRDIVTKLLRCVANQKLSRLRLIVQSNNMVQDLKTQQGALLNYDKLTYIGQPDIERFVAEWRRHNIYSRRKRMGDPQDPRVLAEIPSLMKPLPDPRANPREYHRRLNELLREQKLSFLKFLWV